MSEVILNAVGDISLAGRIGLVAKMYPEQIIDKNLKIILNSADIIVGNFEMPFLPTSGRAYSFETREEFIVYPESSRLLGEIKFSVLSIANNHILDWGEEGINLTKKILMEYNITPIGAGVNLFEAQKPFIITVKGIKFLFLSANKKGRHFSTKNKPGSLSVESLFDILPKVINKVDHIVLILHWGVEYSSYPSPEDVDLAHKFVDLGVRLIIGCGAHTLQGIEEYKNSLIAYGLGDFIMDKKLDTPPSKESWLLGHYTGVLKVIFGKHTINSWEFIPAIIEESRVVLANEETSIRIKKHLEKISNNIGNKELFYISLGDVISRDIKNLIVLFKRTFKKYGLKAFYKIFQIIKFRHLRYFLSFIVFSILKKKKNQGEE